MLSKRWSQERPKGYLIAARVLVILAGLLFARGGVLLIAAGFVGASWGLIPVGAVVVLLSLLLVGSGFARSRNAVFNAPVVFLAEVIFRVFG